MLVRLDTYNRLTALEPAVVYPRLDCLIRRYNWNLQDKHVEIMTAPRKKCIVVRGECRFAAGAVLSQPGD